MIAEVVPDSGYINRGQSKTKVDTWVEERVPPQGLDPTLWSCMGDLLPLHLTSLHNTDAVEGGSSVSVFVKKRGDFGIG